MLELSAIILFSNGFCAIVLQFIGVDNEQRVAYFVAGLGCTCVK